MRVHCQRVCGACLAHVCTHVHTHMSYTHVYAHVRVHTHASIHTYMQTTTGRSATILLLVAVAAFLCLIIPLRSGTLVARAEPQSSESWSHPLNDNPKYWLVLCSFPSVPHLSVHAVVLVQLSASWTALHARRSAPGLAPRSGLSPSIFVPPVATVRTV